MKTVTLCLLVGSVQVNAQCLFTTNTVELASISCEPKFKGGGRSSLVFERQGDIFRVLVDPPVDSFALQLANSPAQHLFPGTLSRADLELVKGAAIEGGVFVSAGERTVRSINYNESTLILGAIECLLSTLPKTQRETSSTHADSHGRLGGILPLVDGKVTYEDVVLVDSTSKDDLYKRAQRWFVRNYRSAKDVIQYENVADAEIIGKGFFTVNWVIFIHVEEVSVYHAIAIRCKDGRFKYTVSDAIIRYYADGYKNIPGYLVETALEDWLRNPSKQHAQNVYADIDTHIKATIASLRKAMASPTDENDW